MLVQGIVSSVKTLINPLGPTMNQIPFFEHIQSPESLRTKVILPILASTHSKVSTKPKQFLQAEKWEDTAEKSL